MPKLEEARLRALALGVRLVGFESMCGIPLCLVPAEFSTSADDRVIPPGADEGEFVRADACKDCDLGTRCWGVRRGYASLYGTSEMRAVRRGTRAC